MNHNRSSPIAGVFKLDIDAFQNLFDWLSLVDLKVLRSTCKGLKTVIDEHIKLHYPTVRIGYRKVEHFHDTESNCINLIKEIRLLNYKQKFQKEFQENSHILSHVECIRLFKNCVEGEFYDVLLKFCPNLKNLTIARIRDDTIIGISNDWLLRSYPNLENFKLLDFLEPAALEIGELKTFFELNPNIQTFSTSLQFLKVNGNCLRASNSNLYQLCIYITSEHYNLIDDVIYLLNELHRHDFYQCLYLYRGCLCGIDNVNYNELVLMPSLEKIRFPSCEQLILPLLPGLKKLKIGSIKKANDWEILVKSISNVERVFIEKGSLRNIEPLIRHFAKLKHIKVGFDENRKDESNGYFIEGQSQNLSFINYLSLLNEERNKLAGATKTTIYIDEKIFLTIKWTWSTHEFNLIELKRSEAFEWENHCWYELNDGEDKLK